MLLLPIEIYANYTAEGEMLPSIRQRLLKEGWTLEKIEEREERAKELIEEVTINRENLKKRGNQSRGLPIEDLLSEGYITLEDLI